MRWAGSSSWGVAEMAVLASLLLPSSSAMLTCDNILADGVKFDLSKLKGPHSVVTTEMTGATQKNTTFTIDLCGPLKRKGKVDKAQKCPEGTRLCGITQLRLRSDLEAKPAFDDAIPIWGAPIGAPPQDHTAVRLKTADSNSDHDKTGVRLTLEGAKHKKVRQKAIIEMVCAKNKTGTEGEWPPEVEYESASASSSQAGDMMTMIRARDDADKPEEGSGAKQLVKDKEDPALVWKSYGMEGDAEVLRLTWHSLYACEEYANGGSQTSQHWGFFTWFVVLVFLATAAYLIFGSWLNYNRYGARGWDLLPHGDTIRDVPYLMKDWVRRLINTVQGSGSRGGYSAV